MDDFGGKDINGIGLIFVMGKIKVCLRYPWKTSDSQYYKSMIDNPPEGVDITNSIKKVGNITSSSKKFAKSNRIKKYVRKVAGLLSAPNVIIPNKNDNYSDLIHCAHSLYLGDMPWVTDVEMYWSFASSHEIALSRMGRKRIKKMLKKDSCKKIIAWTNTAKKQIIENLDDKNIEKKITVISHAVPLPQFKKTKKDKINLLFLARYFYSKGGLQSLKVMDVLTKKYKNVYGIIIGGVPEEIIKKYSSNKKIKIMGLTPHKKIMKDIYPDSDIFIYPGFSDSFGFAIPEAMSFGLPVISVDRFSRKDLIKNNKTGFVVDFPEITYKWNCVNGVADGIPQIPNEDDVLDDMVTRASQLIESPKLLKKMSENCKEEVRSGMFSIKERNKKLKKVYKEAIR